MPQGSITSYVRSATTGAHNRRAWFLYEFLTGRMLDIEDAAEAGFSDLLDNRVYFTGAPVPSRRHKVRDNLLGNKDFCPIIRRTKTLTDFGSRARGELPSARGQPCELRDRRREAAAQPP